MRVLSMMFLVVVTGCIDYGLDQDDDDASDDSSVEHCNGVDDDGDGLVDEGFDDSDGDGIADCVDDDCVVELPLEDQVPVLEECEDNFSIQVSDPS